MVLLCHGQSFNTCVDGISLSYCKVFFFNHSLSDNLFFSEKCVCTDAHAVRRGGMDLHLLPANSLWHRKC